MHLKKVGLALTLVVMVLPGWGWAEDVQSVTKLDEIVVTGTRTPHALKDAPVETTLITREEIEQSNAQTVSDLVKTIPGLSAGGIDDIYGSTSSRVRLRGLSFNNGYGLILIDGQRVHASGQSGGHGEYATGLNQIPVSMIERIEVVKGPSSVLYGSDAMAGVINIITRKVPEKGSAGAGVKYGWYKVKERVRDGEVSRPTDDGHNRTSRSAYAYAGNKIGDRTGFLLNYAHQDSERSDATPVDINGDAAMGKMDFLFSDQVNGWLKGEISNFERGGTSTSEENDYRIAAGMQFKPSENHVVMLKGYHYVDDFDAESSASHRHGKIGYDQIEAQYTWYAGTSHAISAGAEFQRQTIDYLINNKSSTLTSTTTVLEDVDTVSVYLQDEWTLFGKLVVVPGLRYDNHSTFGDSFNPKLNLMYRVLENTSLRASVGKSFKSPTIRQLYYDIPFYHSPFWIQSNPDLEPEESIGYSAGIEQWFLENRGMVNVSYFRNEIDDMVVTDRTGQTYEGSDLYIYENVDEATVQGVEVTAQLFLNDSFSVSGGYAFTDSENESTGKELTYTPEHQFNISTAYEYLPLGLGMSATMVYASDQYTDDDNEYTQDAHVVVDAKIFKRLNKVAKLTFEADNIFDSDKGDERNYRTGRTFMIGIDIDY